MSTVAGTGELVDSGLGVLDRDRIIAKAGFNRWLVPPAALCIHLCIGMAYGFSVFWLPLSRALGVTAAKTCPDISLVQELFTTTCDWRIASMGWMFTLFFVVLGVSAALWGGWLERVGPRKAGVVAAFCWAGGLILGAIGIYVQPIMADVARLRRDRRHRAWSRLHLAGVDLGQMVSRPARHGDGMAIMGFGGGAMIGAPLANLLMNYFKTSTRSAHSKHSSPWQPSISSS
jgi:hypothetical protein